ncbi:DUF5677 domain-containing protein [Nocardia sp. NPDC004415]
MTDRGELDLSNVVDYQVDFTALESASSETIFMRESFELLKEAAQLLTLAAATLDADQPEGFDRDEAILVGHLVRMVKLMRSVIRGVADDHGGDQTMQLTRQFLDSASILKYLLADATDLTRRESYVLDSLIAEKEFLKNVRQQIDERGGDKLNIEERIERSIHLTFDTAGVREDAIPSRKQIRWPNAENRIRLLGPTAYSAYRAGSGSIHGSWHDLERNHLEVIDGKFQLDFNPAPDRPQPLFTMALIAAMIAQEYLDKCIPTAGEAFSDRLESYVTKLGRANDLHEEYLTQRFADEPGSDPE